MAISFPDHAGFHHKNGSSLHWRRQICRSGIPNIADWCECPEDEIEVEEILLSDDESVDAVFERGELIGFINEAYTPELGARVVAARARDARASA